MGIFTYFKKPDQLIEYSDEQPKQGTVMVGIFRTNIIRPEDATDIKAILNYLLRPIRITFDLEDCDRILRVEAKFFDAFEVINTVNICGFNCELLD